MNEKTPGILSLFLCKKTYIPLNGMRIVKNIQKLSHEIVVYAKDGRESHLTLH